MKLKQSEDFNELSPNDVIDTLELDLSEEEKIIFSDAVLLAQQYNKYVKDFKSGKRTNLTNKDNITWYKRFLYDALQRNELIEKINNPLLNRIAGIVSEMNVVGLKFLDECLQIDGLYEKTIEDISNNSLNSIYDIKLFISECTSAKKRHIVDKIDMVPEKLIKYIMF